MGEERFEAADPQAVTVEWMWLANELTQALPQRPDPEGAAFRGRDGSRDEAAYRDAVEVWRQDCRRVIQGARAASLGASDAAGFDGWAPQGSMAVVEALRAVLVHDASTPGRPVLSPRLARAIGDVIVAQDRLISVPDPDGDIAAMPIYEGRGSLAWRRLRPGVYDATGFDGRGDFKLVIAPPLQRPGQPISAVFPAGAANASVLERIAAAVTSIGRSEQAAISRVQRELAEAGFLDTDEYGRPLTGGRRHDVLAERAVRIRQAQIDDEPLGPSRGPGPSRPTL